MAPSKHLEPLPEVTDYDSSRVEATTPNPIPQNIPNRLSDHLSHLQKLNVSDSICRPVETFTLFPNLPKELRLKIWNYAARQSRTLLLSGTRCLEQTNLDNLQNESTENNNTVPAVLHTCSEARQEGLRLYTAYATPCPRNIYTRPIPGHSCEKQDCFLSGKHQLDKKDLPTIQFLDLECEDPWLLGLDQLNPIILGKRLKELKIVVKEQPWREPLLPNTIDRELNIKEHEIELMDNIKSGRQISWPDPSVDEDEEYEEDIDWQSLEGVEMACMWRWIAEEYDLVPISAGASAGYVAAGGV
ncbi:hypothetical protein NA56DRAFT_705170 [Hyaloscypha hepaticicola]|uniref:2EXR domain-containing protein n=1 Tax=Hyaloscypha hepaticicola TaxID=2082293 RepID=A0A2J6Q0X4_9HELO|nr:hypothetical protein NA56DRAFT_705170 [Hyaloscypha hepaticicola]